MSLVGLFRWDDGILMVSDGVNYDPTTGVVGCANIAKVIPFPHLSCAIGVTGCGDMIGQMAGHTYASGVESFDELVEKFEYMCEEAHGFASKKYWAMENAYLETSVVLAGYSQLRGAFEYYRLVTYRKESTNSETGITKVLEPFVAEKFDNGFWFSGSPSAENFALLPNVDDVDPGAYLQLFLCALRQDSNTEEKQGFQTCVGGMIQMTHIVQNGVNSWINYRWPDDVAGRPLNPSLGEMFPAYIDEIPKPS